MLMCIEITVTRYVPHTNIAGSNIVALAVVTMETLLAFLRNQGDFQKDSFLKDGFAKYDVSAR